MLNKKIEWNEEKNSFLKAERGLSFEAISLAMKDGRMLDVYPHPKYSHQQVLLVDIEGYVVVVPFVEDDKKLFLKTAYHSRKAAKKYFGGKHETIST